MIRLAFSFLILMAAAGFIGGFALFLKNLPTPDGNIPPLLNNQIEALSVFTGSAGRIQTGLGYLQKGFKGPVLITGVHMSVVMDDLEGISILEETQKKRITLDYTAQTTRDNVYVTSQWAAQNKKQHIGVVTAYYHLPRSLLLFKQQGAGLAVYPIPVFPQETNWQVLFKEYSKLVAAYLRLL